MTALVALAVACGGGAAPAEAPATSASPAPQATPTPAPEPKSSEAPAAEPEPESKSPEADPDNRQRQVLYRTTPEGLAVSFEGLEFRAKAEPVKVTAGAFGIRIKVTAESKNDAMHTLMSPQDGPLAIAGTIKRKKGEPVTFGDERGNEDEQFITPGQPLEIERTWPGKDGPFAWYGDEVELQVGLWGVGAAGERRRPLRKMFLVKMVALPGGKPVIMPPRM